MLVDKMAKQPWWDNLAEWNCGGKQVQQKEQVQQMLGDS